MDIGTKPTMALLSTHSQSFAQDLWANVLTQLDGHTNIIQIAVEDFNLLGEDGESFFKNQFSIIMNNNVEFFSDTTNPGRIYLASPAYLGMNFTITMTGERLRALTPIPSFPVDHGYDPGYGMQPGPYYNPEFPQQHDVYYHQDFTQQNELQYQGFPPQNEMQYQQGFPQQHEVHCHQGATQQNEVHYQQGAMQQHEVQYHQDYPQQTHMVPSMMHIASPTELGYYAQEWVPTPTLQDATGVPFGQDTQAVWPANTPSPAPVQAQYSNAVILPMQSYVADAQHVASQPTLNQETLEIAAPQANQLSISPSGDCTAIRSAPDDEALSEDDEDDGEDDGDEEDEEYIPRPPNAFMIYRSSNCHQVQKQFKGIHNSRISTILGDRWKAMSDEEKQPWRDEAARVDAEHKRMYPDWKYQPRKKGAKKPAKKGAKKVTKQETKKATKNQATKNGVNKATKTVVNKVAKVGVTKVTKSVANKGAKKGSQRTVKK